MRRMARHWEEVTVSDLVDELKRMAQECMSDEHTLASFNAYVRRFRERMTPEAFLEVCADRDRLQALSGSEGVTPPCTECGGRTRNWKYPESGATAIACENPDCGNTDELSGSEGEATKNHSSTYQKAPATNECEWASCVNCGVGVCTDDDCLKHPDGSQLNTGEWVCRWECWNTCVETRATQAEALRDPNTGKLIEPDYQNAVCRGSWVLGSACGMCERCDFWRRALAGEGQVVGKDNNE